jgi:hypothetical protein
LPALAPPPPPPPLPPPLLLLEESADPPEDVAEATEADEEDVEDPEELRELLLELLLGTVRVEPETDAESGPCRLPRNCGATSEAYLSAAVVPVSRTVRSRPPAKALTVRT